MFPVEFIIYCLYYVEYVPSMPKFWTVFFFLIINRCCHAVLSHSVVSSSLQPHRLWCTRLLCPRGFSRQKYWSGLPFPLPGDLPNPKIKPRSSTLQEDCFVCLFVCFLPSEPPRKPKITGVGTLYLLHGISLTQESNQGLLHCPQILYQLSYQRSPKCILNFVKSFFSIYWNYHMAFILLLVDMVYHINWCAYIEESLHSWYKLYLIMVYVPFNMLLDLDC